MLSKKLPWPPPSPPQRCSPARAGAGQGRRRVLVDRPHRPGRHPQKNTVPLLPKKIGDLTVEYISLDDASDSTNSVTAFKKLISEQNVDALIGPSGSPNAMGVIQFAAEAGVPMLAPVGTAAVVLPMNEQKKWVFKTTQNDDIIARALVDHMAKTGIKTIGFIGLNDPYGENWHKVFSALAAEKGIKITANERYLRFDSSVTGQALKILAAKPDAVLVAAPARPACCRRRRCSTRATRASSTRPTARRCRTS